MRPAWLLFDRDVDRVGSPLGFVVVLDDSFLGDHGDVVRFAFKHSVLHHDDAGFMASNEAGDVPRIRHARAQHQRIVAVEIC